MAALDFPSSPTNGQVYTANGSSWTYNSTIGGWLSSNAVTSASSPVITGAIVEDVYTISDGAGFAIDPTNGSIQTVTLGANRTPVAANWSSGQSVTLKVADGTAYAITWTTIGVVWVGGTAPTLATSGYTVIELWRDGSSYYGVSVGSVAS